MKFGVINITFFTFMTPDNKSHYKILNFFKLLPKYYLYETITVHCDIALNIW